MSSGSGGLGWYIFEKKNQLLIPEVFAGLLTVIIFGLFVENVIFRLIENRTVRRWGMQTCHGRGRARSLLAGVDVEHLFSSSRRPR